MDVRRECVRAERVSVVRRRRGEMNVGRKDDMEEWMEPK